MMNEHNKGNVFVISAASGTGKTTLVSRLVAHHNDIGVCVSHTTRAPREGEQHGKNYYFVSKDEFLNMVDNNAFLEHAEVFGNFYGTSLTAIESLCNQGIDVILEIDVQGAEQIRQSLPDAVSIFILPPSLAVLEQRLRGRNTDNEQMIARRLAEAKEEIQQAFAFDFVVCNTDLETAEMELLHIIKAQRALQKHQRVNIEKVLKNH